MRSLGYEFNLENYFAVSDINRGVNKDKKAEKMKKARKKGVNF